MRIELIYAPDQKRTSNTNKEMRRKSFKRGSNSYNGDELNDLLMVSNAKVKSYSGATHTSTLTKSVTKDDFSDRRSARNLNRRAQRGKTWSKKRNSKSLEILDDTPIDQLNKLVDKITRDHKKYTKGASSNF